MNRNKLLICLMLHLLILHISGQACVNGSQKSNLDKLHLVKRIYLGEIQSPLVRDPFKSYLKQELEAKGFSIVGDMANADATLTGTIIISIVEDERPIGLVVYDTLKFSLNSFAKGNIWEAKIKVESKTDAEKNAKNRARKLAERIERDWKKSAKAAGIKQ